jgi:hypothetical protein
MHSPSRIQALPMQDEHQPPKSVLRRGKSAGTAVRTSLLILSAIFSACGNKTESASSESPATATPTAPADLVGVYQHPVGEGDQDRRLTITPTGMSVTGEDDSSISWASGTGSSASGWNFICTEESKDYCGRGSIMRSAQGVLASVTDGMDSVSGTSYAGIWVPVGRSASAATTQRVTTIPEWMHGDWVKTDRVDNCTIEYRARIRSTSATVSSSGSGRGSNGQICGSFSREEQTFPAIEGEVEGDKIYRAGRDNFELDGDRMLISYTPERRVDREWYAFAFGKRGTWQRP